MTIRFSPLTAAAMAVLLAAPSATWAQAAPSPAPAPEATATPAPPIPYPAPAAPGFLDPAAILAGALRTVVSYSRLLADVRYDGITVDSPRRLVTLRGLQVVGLVPNHRCRVDIGQMLVSGISFWAEEQAALRFDLTDVHIANNCFGPNGLIIGAILGRDRIELGAMRVVLRSDLGSGAAMADITAEAPGQMRFEISADFDYLALTMPELVDQIRSGGTGGGAQPDAAPGQDQDVPGVTGDPAAPEIGARGILRAAHVTVENLGLWQRVAPMLPPEITDPALMRQALTAGAPPDATPYAEDLADAIEGWLADPARLTAEIRAAAPIAFDTLGWSRPDMGLPLLNPVFSNAPPTPKVAPIASGDPATPDDTLAMGLALASGAGLPRNPARAEALLTPMADQPDVAMALARLVAGRDPAAGYGHALTAAAGGADGALSLLDQIEAQLGTADLLLVQPGSDAVIDDATFASAETLRAAALAREAGDGTPRSYAQGWMLASLAAAAGDGPSRALMDQIEARFGSDPDWIAARDAAAERAAALWQDKALASALATAP